MASRPAAERREDLIALLNQMRTEHECPLAETRTNLVFGAGNADADLMFVGEAPGRNEDEQGLPFVGRAGQLLEQLLGEIDMTRADVFIANVLKCLRYNAMVQLGDGSWERIGRLVRSRYDGDVMSVAESGELVRRRVVGWHATPLGGRRVFRLTYRSAKNAGAHRVGIQLTGDHPVLTERGYVRVDELKDGDRIATGQGLSRSAFDVVCGTLLGDGTLNGSSSYLAFGHSARQADYAAFKSQLLGELRPSMQRLEVAAVAGGAQRYEVVQVRTRADRALRTLRRAFYESRKVVPRWIGDRLNARMVAIWFMDDGYTRIRPGGRRPDSEIATLGFGHEDLRVLQRGLLRLGVRAKALRGRLHFDVQATEALSELIAPYVPPSMRYKLVPDVATRVPFDPGRFAQGGREVFYDDVELEEVTEEARGDATFFCIDVEDTHNFVTAGGVVHNCRPPGNRDPHPDEIEICKPFLFRQIQLIEPRVICTLGNFATKCLSGRPTGITRCHGAPQLRELGGRPVHLFPAFHPAAALRTPSLVETMREDFAKLPGLLEQPLPEPVEDAPDESTPAAGDPEPEVREPAQMDLF